VRSDDRTHDGELVANVSEVAGEVFDRQLVAVAWRPTSTVPSKVPVDYAVVSGEPRSEITPGESITADSIGQDDGRLTLTEHLEEQAGAICRFDKALAVVLHA
jgi:hypothetical protein